ncbi:hypothetical protein NC652_000596 [Populus alba x Populus x berolinensis]|nr:hypothetical protein NC652_000596 [Populus alba x Populus x berolinensis]
MFKEKAQLIIVLITAENKNRPSCFLKCNQTLASHDLCQRKSTIL